MKQDEKKTGDEKTDSSALDENSHVVELETEAMRELTAQEARWVVESPQATPDFFQVLRYYVVRYGQLPSVTSYITNAEARAVLHELKTNMGAKIIQSFISSGGRYVRYAIRFPQKGYLLYTTAITTYNKSQYTIPAFMEKAPINQHDGRIHIGQFQLLRPSEDSKMCDTAFEQELRQYISKCSLSKKPDKPSIYMIEVRGGGFSMVEHQVSDDFEINDMDVHYGYGFEKFHSELMERFRTETKGLILFHGLPGTGKTYYIRHLLRKMASGSKKLVIYMPPNMVDHLVDPSFVTFLLGEVKRWGDSGFFCILLIEDAEPLLAKRVEGVRIQGVTNLLNMSDGLLNDMLNLQIICTFNVDVKKLDSALLRPGRLIARKEFKALSVLDANLLASRLGIKHHFEEPATLSEIYALRKNKNTLVHDVEQDRDASSSIDDLI